MVAANTASRTSSPAVIIAGAQEGVRQASPERRHEFESILLYVIPRFRSIATRLLGNREDAEDAVQDAMLSAFKHIADFDGRAKISTWLTAIVINAIRMQIRRRPRLRAVSLDHPLKEGQSPISETLVDRAPTAEKRLEQFELFEIAIRLTRGLPPSQRHALQCHRQNDFSVRKAASKLGVPEGTVKAQLARGRARLAQQFHDLLSRPRTKHSGVRRETRMRVPAYRPNRERSPQLAAGAFREQAAEARAGA
jgi:RNA polymerase sigma-70 factor (ECF subfamily)